MSAAAAILPLPQANPNRIQAVQVHWVSVEDHLPDDDTTVLVHVSNGEGEPIWPGFHSGDQWFWADGSEVTAAECVTHWADFPEPPELL